jgi:hypothetical protein
MNLSVLYITPDKQTYEFKFWHLYIVIVLLYAAIGYVANVAIYTDSFYYNLLSERMDISRITDMITMHHKYQQIGYLVLPVILLLKFWVLAGIIFIGLYLFNQKIIYKNCLKITLIAELISVVATLVRIVWLVINKPDNINDIQYFSPLSLTQLINIDNFPKYLFYPLQLFNVFEVAYWLVLAYGVMAFTNWNFKKSVKTVALSYGVGLCIWVLCVVFIQLQFS